VVDTAALRTLQILQYSCIQIQRRILCRNAKQIYKTSAEENIVDIYRQEVSYAGFQELQTTQAEEIRSEMSFRFSRIFL
jgi:hypothetical protein